MCRSRQCSLDKVNTEFPALVLDDNNKEMTKPELEMVLGVLASFVDLRTATAGPNTNKAIDELEDLVKKLGLF
eukprot:12663980-Prorocentrum_lima.AAC.1